MFPVFSLSLLQTIWLTSCSLSFRSPQDMSSSKITPPPDFSWNYTFFSQRYLFTHGSREEERSLKVYDQSACADREHIQEGTVDSP